MSARIDDFEALQLKERLEAQRQQEEAVLSSEKRSLWQSVEETSADSEAVKAWRSQEFLESQKQNEPAAEGVSRRRFLQFSAAASALVSTAACTRRPVDHLVPYVKKPQALTYGVPLWYASSTASGFGVLVKTREGKPIKLEGNPDHPVNQGGLDARTQASVFDLYNPDRLKTPVEVSTGKMVTWDEVNAAVDAARASGGVRVLTGPVVSPSTREALSQFTKTTQAVHHISEDAPIDPILEATSVLVGRRLCPQFLFERADVVVSMGADFLGTWLNPLRFTKDFSKRRKINQGQDNLNQLFVFEAHHSITGVAADHRTSLKPSQIYPSLLALGSEVVRLASGDQATRSFFQRQSLSELASAYGLNAEAISAAAQALVAAKGKSLVVASARGQGDEALAVQIAALLLNHYLGNIGQTVDLDRPMITGTESGESLESLISEIEAGSVKALIIQGVNPAYSNPNFAEVLKKVPTVFTLVSEMNETAATSTYALPESHFLEAWGDSEIVEGVFSIQQPVIEPLYQSRSLGEVLLAWAGQPTENFRSNVQSLWRRQVFKGGNFESWWMEQLKAGAVEVPIARRGLGLRTAAGAEVLSRTKPRTSSGLELLVYESIALGDGRFANNHYLQELPDPITKVTWDNYVGVSPALAAKLNLNRNKFDDDDRLKPKILPSNFNSDVVDVVVNGKSISLPVFVQTGLADDTVVVAMGYGRKVAGRIGADVGQNAMNLRTSVNEFSGLSVELKKTGKKYELACTQKQFNLQGRDGDILHQYTLDEFKQYTAEGGLDGKTRKFKAPYVFSIYPENEWVYPGQKWGMAIDLNSCTGCNACVVACYTENNVSTVGRDEVIMGRHQAWMRLDLYHSGEAGSPESAFEPMLCQHCEAAPCETVCPVLATVHSSDGLNDMVYNRCVGTRYCANNCPYKVRRFNWFQYSDKLANKVEKQDPLPMLLNPDVGVRTRGVMEKCSFCVQRIRAEVNSRTERVKDGHIQTACQQSCPADAIIFGDLNDPESRVAQLSGASTGFRVLELLNTKPAVTYLPRVRNKGPQA
jgi:molybdopterin-containing oxidoreductase family iron-sulfur binding subunit